MVVILSIDSTNRMHMARLSTDPMPPLRAEDSFIEIDTGKTFHCDGTSWNCTSGLSYANAAHSHDVLALTGFPGGTATFLRADGAFAAPPGGSSPQLVIPIGTMTSLTWTNMPAAVTLMGGNAAHVTHADLTNFTQARITVTKMAVAGATASKIILRYKTTFDTTAANYLDIGTSEVSVAVNVQNQGLASAWTNLAAGAKADVFLAVVGSGGDGAIDPVFGAISAQFK